MLAVAFAKELSLSNRTLIIDLDFFNRGLTGLMGSGVKICDVPRPSFLTRDDLQESLNTEKWSISQVSDNLFHLVYPDLLPDEMNKFETLDTDLLEQSLKRFIQEVREQCGCDCVVLDCHGGPDNASFAACRIADYALLISEPDRITFYGTLNFLRQLQRVRDHDKPKLYLVFNKVVPAFSALFLRTLYDRLIRKHFSGRPLLAVFPLEVYLTKEFEKTPFLTTVYPWSWLAKKTQILIYDLLNKHHPEKIPRTFQSIPSWIRQYRKLALGKPLPILDVNAVISTVVACLVFMVLLDLSLSNLFAPNRTAMLQQLHTVNVLQCLSMAPDLAKDNDTVGKLLSSRQRGFSLDWPTPSRDDGSTDDKAIQLERQERAYQTCIDHKPGEISNSDMFLDYPDAAIESSRRGPDDSTLYQLASLRSQVLKSADVRTVPPQYEIEYTRAISRLQGMNRVYIGLETLEGLLWPFARLLAYIGAGWLTAVLLINWSLLLDRRFTYYTRQGRRLRSLVPLVVAMAVWLLPLILLISVVAGGVLRAVRFGSALDLKDWVAFAASILAAATPLTIVGVQLCDIYRDLRYGGHYVEDGLRLLFVAYLVTVPALLFLRLYHTIS